MTANNKIDTRQSVQRAALPMVGSAAEADASAILTSIDAELGKLFEDRNVALAGGGDLSWNTTTNNLTMTAALTLHVNSRVGGGAPVVISLGATTRAFSIAGNMLYAVIDRIAGTATVTADVTLLPSMVSSTQELFLIAKRVGNDLYFRNGHRLEANRTTKLSGPNFYGTLNTVDNTMVRTDGTDGKTVQGTNITISDTDVIASVTAMALGASAPVATAQLQGTSITKGWRPPIMTTTQRDAILSPAKGLFIVNDTTNSIDFYDGTVWVSFSGNTSPNYTYVELKANDLYAVDTFVDCTAPINEALKVYNVFIYNGRTGTAGAVVADVLYSTDFGTSWTTMFGAGGTKPALGITAVSGTYAGIGDVVTGITSPVFTGAAATISLPAKSAVRLDINSIGTAFGDLCIVLALGK